MNRVVFIGVRTTEDKKKAKMIKTPIPDGILKARLQIISTLFPEGIKAVEIWQKLIVLLSRKSDEHLTIDALEQLFDRKLKLRKRIKKEFPNEHDLQWIIFHGDMDLLRKITLGSWKFSESHRPFSKHIIVLHGVTPREALMDWAAQSVITMLIRHLDVDI